MSFDSQDGTCAMFSVAFIITIEVLRLDFAQIVQPDWLAAQRAEWLRAGRSAIHQDESHVAPPIANRQ
jgi:hypothetical protein